MDAYFLDSSALIKLYARETGTEWIVSLCGRSTGNSIFIVRVTPVESASGLAKQHRIGAITEPELDQSINRLMRGIDERFAFVEITKRLVSFAIPLVRRYGLRSFEAIQLAAALDISYQRASVGLSQVIFVSADAKLNQAAISETLRVENPNDHQ
jgi:predicted nucleic acid-binding protein